MGGWLEGKFCVPQRPVSSSWPHGPSHADYRAPFFVVFLSPGTCTGWIRGTLGSDFYPRTDEDVERCRKRNLGGVRKFRDRGLGMASRAQAHWLLRVALVVEAWGAVLHRGGIPRFCFGGGGGRRETKVGTLHAKKICFHGQGSCVSTARSQP